GIVALVDVGGDLAPAVKRLHGVVAAFDLRQLDERAAFLVDRDPGLAVDDIKIRIGPGHPARLAVNDLVPLEALLEIEVLLPQHQPAAEHVFISLDNVPIGKGGGLGMRRGCHPDCGERRKNELLHGPGPFRRVTILTHPPGLLDGEYRWPGRLGPYRFGPPCVTLAASSKRIDVVHDRDLAQDHLTDDVARLYLRGIARRGAGGAGGQLFGELTVVELDAHRERRRTDLSRHHGGAGSLHLARRRRLQYRDDFSGEDLAGKELERDLDVLALLDIAR